MIYKLSAVQITEALDTISRYSDQILICFIAYVSNFRQSLETTKSTSILCMNW